MTNAESAPLPHNSNLADIEAMRLTALQDIYRPDGEEVDRIRERVRFLNAIVDEPAYLASQAANRDQLSSDLALLESLESGEDFTQLPRTDIA